jgi:hypothetical protein
MKYLNQKSKEQDSYRTWILFLLVPFYTISTSILLINSLIDSHSYLSEGKIKNVIKDLLAGNIIAELDFTEQRIFNKYLIKSIPNEVDVIAIGSSRTMGLRKRYISEDITFYNHAMSRGTLGDYISIIGAYRKVHQYIPKVIIMGIDPWIFNEESSYNYSWENLKEFYFNITTELDENNSHYHRRLETRPNEFLKITSIDYLKRNINFFWDSKVKNKKLYHLLKRPNGLTSIEPDASFHYPDKYLNRSTEKILEDSRNMNLILNPFQKFNKLSYQSFFEKFLTFLKDNKITIYFYLPSFHPESYKLLTLREEGKMIIKSENYIRSLAQKYNIEVISSYDPSISNFKHKDFMDGLHLRDHALERDFKFLKDKLTLEK